MPRGRNDSRRGCQLIVGIIRRCLPYKLQDTKKFREVEKKRFRLRSCPSSHPNPRNRGNNNITQKPRTTMTATSKKKATAGTSKEISTRKKSTSSGRPRSTSASWTHPASLPMNTRVIQMVKTPHTVVNHSYVDYSLVPPGPEDKNRPKQIQQMDFHQKLYSILGRDDLKDIIGWLPHGRAFRVNVPSRFEKVVCQEYFRHTRYSSFLYQLGLHGYKQISTGRDRGAYYSPVRLEGDTVGSFALPASSR